MQNCADTSTKAETSQMKTGIPGKSNVQLTEDPREKWDYVGGCEWTGTYDEDGWPQDTDWGHESKYGNKRFGKGRLEHM